MKKSQFKISTITEISYVLWHITVAYLAVKKKVFHKSSTSETNYVIIKLLEQIQNQIGQNKMQKSMHN